jgi:uncharacterized protein
MKLDLDRHGDHLHVRAYGEGWIEIGEHTLRESCLLLPHQVLPNWRPQRFEDLVAADLAALAEHAPEIVLLGTGARLRFPPQGWIVPLHAAGIGCEVMGTGAACRSFNILASDGRRVLAALFPIEAGG